MSRLDRRRPLTSTELTHLAENIEDLSNIEDEYDVDFQEILSESEDNLESQSEEDYQMKVVLKNFIVLSTLPSQKRVNYNCFFGVPTYKSRWIEMRERIHRQNVDKRFLYTPPYLLIKAGGLRCGKESTVKMWTRDSSIRRPIFCATMSVNRFEEISRFLRLDDKTTRIDRKKEDKLAAIKKFWTYL
ncbi:Transposase IS4 [Popillia japonica]|uniref:Transposase IS4 n=1 Tax=Popillia japonica TaxID=7064 RepID=A0AAW1LAE9_POPJA